MSLIVAQSDQFLPFSSFDSFSFITSLWEMLHLAVINKKQFQLLDFQQLLFYFNCTKTHPVMLILCRLKTKNCFFPRHLGSSQA